MSIKCSICKFAQFPNTYTNRGGKIECWSCIDKNNSKEVVDAIIKGHEIAQRHGQPDEYKERMKHDSTYLYHEANNDDYVGNAEQRAYQAQMDAGWEY